MTKSSTGPAIVGWAVWWQRAVPLFLTAGLAVCVGMLPAHAAENTGDRSARQKFIIERLTLFEGALSPRKWSSLNNIATCSAAGSAVEAWTCGDPAAGFMDLDLARSNRLTDAELDAMRNGIAVQCLANVAGLDPAAVTFPERWTIAACLRDAYLKAWEKEVEPHGAFYRAGSRIAALHPACIRDLLDDPKQVSGISYEICNDRHRAVPFETIGEGVGRTSAVQYPGWGAWQQPEFRYQLGGRVRDDVLVLGTFDARGGAAVDSGIAFVRLDKSLALVF